MSSVQRTGGKNRVLLRGLVVLGLGLSLVGAFAPQALSQSQDSERENVTLEGTHNDVQFLAGRTVRITATVNDDVFAAGREVSFQSAKVKNIVAAGYDVEQRGGTASDMIAAAANLTVAGTIEDDLVAAARSMRISSAATIGGDARLAAETIDVEGTVNGTLRAAARKVTISGKVAGKVDLLAERIVIASGATIDGDLIYRSKNEPEIAEGATINGNVRRVSMQMPDLRRIGRAILGIGLVIALAWAIAILVLVVVVMLVFPNLVAEGTRRLQAQPWANLGRGIAIVLVGGALAGLFCWSILGLPLGGALMLAIAVVSLLGLVMVSYCIGLVIRRWVRGSGEVHAGGGIGWMIIGAIIVGLVALIPFVGGIISGLAVAAGFGAASAELWKRLRAA